MLPQVRAAALTNYVEVARMTGYTSASSFTRWFAGEFGMAPAQWRAEEREGV